MTTCANPNFSELYTNATPISVWPQRAYPAQLGQRMSAQQLRSAQTAWNFFEEVETHDAAQRQLARPVWFAFVDTTQAELYRRGQLLHVAICPCVNWTSQRYQPLVAPGGDVRPMLCADVIV